MSLELLNNPFTGNFKDWDKPWENEDFQAKFPAFPSKQENTTRRKSFEEISFERKFGEENKCIETNLGKFFSGQMKIDELINDLYDNQYNNDFFFNFGNYAMNYGFALNDKNPDMILTLIKNASADFSKSVKYKYQTNEQYTREADISVELNLMPCLVDITQPGFEYILDSSSESIKYCIKYVYSNYLGKRIFDESKKTYTLGNDYNAIIISSKNGDDFLAIVNDSFKSNVSNSIITNFLKELKSTTTPEGLKFLYENMPSFVIKEIFVNLKEEVLWKHFIILTGNNNSSAFSIGENTSGAIIKLLSAFQSSTLIFEKFKSDQTLVKHVYENLNGESDINGQKISNKIAFASLVSALCIHHKMEGLRKISNFFSYGDYNSISTKDKPRDENGNEFFLQKMKDIPPFGIDFLPLDSFNDTVPDDDRGSFYHPLDMVLLTDTSLENPYPDIVAAILIKAIADEKEKIERDKLITAGLDLLAVILGVATGNPLLVAAAVLGGINLTATAFEKDILQMEGGEEFLNEWKRIYLAGNLILTLPLAAELLVKGYSLFRIASSIGKADAVNFLKSCMVRIILEKNMLNFAETSLKEKNAIIRILDVEELPKATAYFFTEFEANNLLKQGVVVVESTEKGIKDYAFIYKGEAIIRGQATEKNYKTLMLLLKRNYANPFKLLDRLEELRVIAFCKRMPKISNKFPHEKMPKDGFEEIYSIDRNGNFINKKGGLLNDEFNFVLIKDGKLKIGNRHHFLANAEDVVAAGNINVKNGKVVNVDNLSGHYKPTEEEAFRYIEIFKNLNFPIKRARLEIFKFKEVGNGYINEYKYKTIEFKK